MDSGWLRKNSFDGGVTSSSSAWGQVTPLPFVGADEDLVEALRKGHPGAATAFYDRYVDVVDRILSRIVGAHDEERMPELIQQAILAAISGVGRLRDPARLQGWVAAASVNVARGHLRRRARASLYTRLLGRQPLEAAPQEPRLRGGDAFARAMQASYEILDTLPVDERIVLALRIIDAMPLAEIAEVTRLSLGRLKRRLRRAEARFVTTARGNAALRPWLEKGSRWSLPTLG
jgi:RNA polymerase sigma-70 factor, ECF subfamily